MKKILLWSTLCLAGNTYAAEVVLEKKGVTLTDEDILFAASDLSDKELEAMRSKHAMFRSFIENQFDNKVMNAAIAGELKNDKAYQVLSEMNANNFANHYYVKQKALEKINNIKDFKTLAKQKYYSRIDSYKGPQTYDYYHILFVKQEGDKAKEKAAKTLSDITSNKITIAEAAKTYRSEISGTDENGVMKKVEPKQLLKPIHKAALALKLGEASDAIETSAGYHIIGLKNANDVEVIPFNETIEKEIINELKTDIYRSTNKEIRGKYKGPEGLTVNADMLESVSDKVLQGK